MQPSAAVEDAISPSASRRSPGRNVPSAVRAPSAISVTNDGSAPPARITASAAAATAVSVAPSSITARLARIASSLIREAARIRSSSAGLFTIRSSAVRSQASLNIADGSRSFRARYVGAGKTGNPAIPIVVPWPPASEMMSASAPPMSPA